MDVGQEVVDSRPSSGTPLADEPGQLMTMERLATLTPEFEQITAAPQRTSWGARAYRELRFPAMAYFGTRVLLLVIAWVCDLAFPWVNNGQNSLGNEIANWDGHWYIRLATLGYPQGVSHAQTTLGFLPLYSAVMWAVAHVTASSYVVSGLVVSTIGGFVATVLVQRLTTSWWGPEVARKAVLLFCVFAGTIVFSMDYSEGLLIPLIAGCMLALRNRWWLLAGVLAAMCTAIGPDALAVVPMCAVASLVELRNRGWRDRQALESLAAPILAPLGAVVCMAFFWYWAGSPFASFTAQSYGWHETTTLVAIPHQVGLLVSEMGFHFAFWHIDLNVVVALLGTVMLVAGWRYLWRDRRTVPVEVLVFTAVMTFLMVTSFHVPPNPRMLITAFPVVLVFAKYMNGIRWHRFMASMWVLLIVLSAFTYTGRVLRP